MWADFAKEGLDELTSELDELEKESFSKELDKLDVAEKGRIQVAEEEDEVAKLSRLMGGKQA